MTVLEDLRYLELPNLGLPIYAVGGAVRDAMLDVKSKDLDFAVEAPSYEDMREAILAAGCTIFTENPEFVTVRAQYPGHPVLDYVLCRKDGPSSDGRRPDFVTPGTILDDLARRDFTVNAMAFDMSNGELIDPHNGAHDVEVKLLHFVGDPYDRIREDGLRVLRALRFTIVRGFDMGMLTQDAVFSGVASKMLYSVSIERIREELEMMLRHDTPLTLQLLWHMADTGAIWRDGLHLSATLKS